MKVAQIILKINPQLKKYRLIINKEFDLSKLRDNLENAAFYTQYRNSAANVRVTENLVFIFDFEEATIVEETYKFFGTKFVY